MAGVAGGFCSTSLSASTGRLEVVGGAGRRKLRGGLLSSMGYAQTRLNRTALVIFMSQGSRTSEDTQ